MQIDVKKTIDRLYSGDKRALARLLTYVENRHEDLLGIMAAVYPRTKNAHRIGITGPPGAGKSTLVSQLIRVYRSQSKTVGVIAIDPSSPFSGGALLGDRIRMQDHNADEGVFIRSVGSRGARGGLSRATRDMVNLLDAFGFDVILIETVGVGQTELDIMALADTTLVVLVPESGDTVQTMKAGLLEIATIFLVNKADREGADKIFADLKSLAEMSHGKWLVPVVKTVAVKGQGIDELMQEIGKHSDFLKNNLDTKQTDRFKMHECLDVALSEVELIFSQYIEKLRVAEKDEDNPYLLAQGVLKHFKL